MDTQTCKCENPKLRYIQPAVRKSFKPDVSHQPPESSLENETIYKKSYLPVDADTSAQCRLPSAKFESDLQTNKYVPMDTNTTNLLSYGGYKPQERRAPFVPRQRILQPKEPMSQLTTNRHDFVPKTVQRRAPFTPDKSALQSTEPLDDKTTSRLSYGNPDGGAPNQILKPTDNYIKYEGPGDWQTIYKGSYLPVDTKKMEIPPWALKKAHSVPNVPMENRTIHKESFLPPGVFVCGYDDEDENTSSRPSKEEPMYPTAGL